MTAINWLLTTYHLTIMPINRFSSYYTGYYSKLKEYRKVLPAILPVSISLYPLRNPPKDMVNLECARPTPELLKGYQQGTISEAQYREQYMKILDANAHNIVAMLYMYASLYPHHIVMFLCYESPDKFCHRHIFAEWLRANLCKSCSEIAI